MLPKAFRDGVKTFADGGVWEGQHLREGLSGEIVLSGVVKARRGGVPPRQQIAVVETRSAHGPDVTYTIFQSDTTARGGMSSRAVFLNPNHPTNQVKNRGLDWTKDGMTIRAPYGGEDVFLPNDTAVDKPARLGGRLIELADIASIASEPVASPVETTIYAETIPVTMAPALVAGELQQAVA